MPNLDNSLPWLWNSSIGSSLYKDLNSENIESKIARNNINRRFLMTNREFDEIISYFKKFIIFLGIYDTSSLKIFYKILCDHRTNNSIKKH